ncbi:MAG: putative toxin-antitoxin system toxin component, PIN family [Chloroflexota bacterium]
MKVVIDTNVLVSARIGPLGKPAQIMKRVGTFEHLTSSEILAEAKEVLHRRHIQRRYHLSAEDINTYLNRLQDVSTILDPSTAVAVIKDDPDDNIFLAVAIEGGADYIVSGDLHLIRLGKYEGIPILTPARFLELLMGLEEGSGA